MKHAKKPTRAQKILIRSYRLDPNNWLVVKDLPDGQVQIVHKHTGTQRIIKQFKEHI